MADVLCYLWQLIAVCEGVRVRDGRYIMLSLIANSCL